MRFRHTRDMVEERTIEVPERLRPWISRITESRATADTVVTDRPDHATTLIVRWAPGGRPHAVVAGPRTRAFHHTGVPGPSCLKVRLRPGRAERMLGRSPRGLVDRAAPLREVWGRPAPVLPEDPAALVDALLEGAPDGPGPRGDLVGRAAELLAAHGVAESARRLHVSERHLRGLFTDAVGLPPKRFARLDRVRAVLERGAGRPLTEVAATAGYSDHSHLTADFRAFMGVPPTVYFSGGVSPDRRCPGDGG